MNEKKVIDEEMCERMKAHACELMEKLGMGNGYADEFRILSRIPYFADGEYVGSYSKRPDLIAKVEALEVRSGCLVYAIIEDTLRWNGSEFRILNLLFVSKYEEDWQYEFASDGVTHRVYAYCHNLDDEDLSEMGSILVENVNGNLRRVG